MRRLAIALVLVLAACGSTVAPDFSSEKPPAPPTGEEKPETGEINLETQVQNATGIVRTISADLRAKAANRVQEIKTDFSHVGAGLAYGQAEVIGWNRGYEKPLAAVISGWLASPAHAHILLNPYYTQIGCAWDVSPATTDTRETTWLVCWFQRADKPATVIAPPNAPVVDPKVVIVLPPYVGTIPDAAMEAR